MKNKYVRILNGILRRIVSFPKLIFWQIPFAKYYYAWKFSNLDSVVLLPHEGLGDLIVIYSAIIELSKKNKKIYLAVSKNVYSQIEKILPIPQNVFLMRIRKNNANYVLSPKYRKIISCKGKLLALGNYGRDPIYSYPNSFYFKMGVDSRFALKNLPIKELEDPKLIDGKYDYINMKNSKEDLMPRLKQAPKHYVAYISPNELLLNGKEVLLPPEISLSINLYLALNASEIFVSDGGFFNLLNLIGKKPKVSVFTRKLVHSHNKELYPFPFDGGVHTLEPSNLII